ncbi:MAG: serine hydrolase domain-containing protein [Gracilimonas sp.]
MPKYFIISLFIALFATGTHITNQPVNTETEAKIDSTVQVLHAKGQFNGVVLLEKNEEIHYSNAMGKANFSWDIPNTLNTRFRIASITKTFTATLVLYLIEKGELNLEDAITEYLPDYPPATGNKITIEHLLALTSGIPDYLNIPGFMETKSALHHDRNRFPEYFNTLELNFEPGTDWNYGNSEYYLLGLIIEKITGMSYESALTKYILEPTGLDNTGFINSTRIDKFAMGYLKTSDGFIKAPYIDSSICFSAGMMYSTAGDLVQFMTALYSEKSILSKEYVVKMTTRRIEDYGYGVFIGNQNIGDINYQAFVHLGEIHGYASQVTYFPESDYTLVILDNTQQSPSQLYFAIRDHLADYF